MCTFSSAAERMIRHAPALVCTCVQVSLLNDAKVLLTEDGTATAHPGIDSEGMPPLCLVGLEVALQV